MSSVNQFQETERKCSTKSL